MKTTSQAALFTVFLAVLIDLMGFGIVLPLLPFYASFFNASAVEVGLLYSIYSFAQLIFSPIWGSLSDRFGRRPIMLISTFGACVAYLIFGFAHSLLVLFLSRLIAGMMGGNISTAQAYVADVTTHEDRAKGMGLIGAAFGIGFVSGPAIASILIHPRVLEWLGTSNGNQFLVPGLFAAGLSLTSFALVWFKLPETVHAQDQESLQAGRPGIFSKSFWKSLSSGKSTQDKHFFWLLLGCFFLLTFAQSSLYSSFPLFCKNELGLSAGHVGMVFVYMGVIAIIIQGTLMKKLAHTFGEERLFFVGSILLLLGIGLIPFASTQTLLYLFIGIMSIGGSLMIPTINSLISKESEPTKIGAAMGTAQGIGSLGRVIGPTWGGALYSLGHRIPFFLTALCLVITIWGGAQIEARAKKRSLRTAAP